MNLPSIIVLGAGVSGLTTAVRLIEAGYPVRILTREPPERTTSAVAAAIWFPYEAGPVDKANRWSAISFHEFARLARQPGTGVRWRDFLILTRPELDNSWKDELPAGAVRVARPEELPPGYAMGYMASVPLAETQLYLPYLLDRFRQGGGELLAREVKAVEPLLKDGHLVVNCTGLRPKRPAIRCEKEEGRNVFHNYGHGGAGFTVSWGCADEVLRLVGEQQM